MNMGQSSIFPTKPLRLIGWLGDAWRKHETLHEDNIFSREISLHEDKILVDTDMN